MKFDITLLPHFLYANTLNSCERNTFLGKTGVPWQLWDEMVCHHWHIHLPIAMFYDQPLQIKKKRERLFQSQSNCRKKIEKTFSMFNLSNINSLGHQSKIQCSETFFEASSEENCPVTPSYSQCSL